MADIYWPFDPALVIEWPGASSLAIRPNHFGTDIPVPQGTPLRATMSGMVDVIWDDGLGTWVIDIINPDGTVVRNGHLSRMDVIDWQWVNAGDHIGLTGGQVGTLGAGLSTGAHLHWEIRNNQGWGNWGWYDPRDLTIRSFAELDAPAKAKSAVKRRKQGNMFMVFYKDAAGKGKGRWLVVGTPRYREIASQSNANHILTQLGIAKALECGSREAWDSFCYMAGKPIEGA